MVKRHQRGDAGRRATLAYDVLERRRSNQHHVIGVAVEPNVVGDHTKRVDLTVDQWNAVQRGNGRAVLVARVDHRRLSEARYAGRGTVGDRMITLFHVNGVEGAVLGFADVPFDNQSAAFVVGRVVDRCTGDRVGCIVIVELTCWNNGTYDGHVGQVFLPCLVDAGKADPYRDAGRLLDDGLIPLVWKIRRERCSPEGIHHRRG